MEMAAAVHLGLQVDARALGTEHSVSGSRPPAISAEAPSVPVPESSLGAFGVPWRTPGPPKVCLMNCGREANVQHNVREPSICCMACVHSDGAAHSQMCDERMGNWRRLDTPPPPPPPPPPQQQQQQEEEHSVCVVVDDDGNDVLVVSY